MYQNKDFRQSKLNYFEQIGIKRYRKNFFTFDAFMDSKCFSKFDAQTIQRTKVYFKDRC